jgi:ketosteroid isomerase-like protein
MRELLERLRQGWESMDAEASLACFAHDPRIIVIGTDAHEYWTGFSALVEPFRAMTTAFSEARYAWGEPGPAIEMLGDAAWAAGVLQARFKTADGWIDLPMRTTVVACPEPDGVWKIRHAHFSLAAAEPVAY